MHVSRTSPDAGVAHQTVRAKFGTKRGILPEILRRATLGPAFDEILTKLRQTPDPRQRLHMVARLDRQVHESKEAELALLRGVGVVAPELTPRGTVSAICGMLWRGNLTSRARFVVCR